MDNPPPVPAQEAANSSRPNPSDSRGKGNATVWGTWVGAAVALAAVMAVFAVGAFFLFRAAPTNGLAKDADDEAPAKDARDLFKSWPRNPDLALVFSGQSIGYLQPCGCSSPQFGGLARRFNLLQSLKDRGWKVVAVDVGDIAQTQGTQALLKYRTALRSLEAMGYDAVGLGKNEFLMPLSSALAVHALQRPEPRHLAANLANTEPGGLWHKMNIRKSEVVKAGPFQVGILSIVGPTEAKKITDLLPNRDKQDVRFLDAGKALEAGLKDLKAKEANISILLFQGSEQEAAQYIADAHGLYRKGQAPLLHAVLCLDEFSDPRGLPTQIDKIPTQIITLGHKGKHVGVLGLFRNEKSLEMRYQLVPIGPEFEPVAGDEKKNPVLPIMQAYADELKKRDFLSPRLSPRSMHPTQVTHANAYYVGSERCMDCHEHAGAVWNKTAHSHAYKTLVDAKFPTGRQYDPECIVCHTVGFQHKTGFADPPAGAPPRRIAQHNEKLRNVGCESCHGPGSEHVANPMDAKLYPLINPYRPTDAELDPNTPNEEKDRLFSRRMNLIEWNQCQKCHDMENDVHWSTVGFETKYITRGVIHNTPDGRGDTAMKNAEARKKKTP